MILLLHNRYRVPGGEERAVADLRWLIQTGLDEEVAIIEHDSAQIGRARAAAGLLAGGLDPERVAARVRATGARVLHAHNVTPAFGWRALAAARAAGARVVLHLHNYRLVCAVGTCFRAGADCMRCHGRNTLPGVLHGCRGEPAEGLAYAAGIALWQRRLAGAADAIIVPSEFARERLVGLGAPLGDRARVIGSVQRDFVDRSTAGAGEYALYVGRLSPEKGVADAIVACRIVGVPLVIAGEGPQEHELRALAGSDTVSFLGRVDRAELTALRAGAGLALVPSRFAEILPLAALESMAAGLPVVGAAAGGLTEILPPAGLYPPGDVDRMADRIRALYRDSSAGDAALTIARARFSPDVIASELRATYSLPPAKLTTCAD